MAYIDIGPEGTDIIITSELREKELVKAVPGSRWDSNLRQWRIPLSWGSCITMRGIFGLDLIVSETLSDWSWNEFNERVNPAASMRDTLECADLMEEEPNLYPFQRSGVKFLEAARSALIADEMGAGKTIQLIRTIDRNAQYPALIVAPNTMKLTWRAEFLKWTDLAPESVVVVEGPASKRRKQIRSNALVYIINWESLRLHSRMESFGNRSLTDKEKELKELNAIDWVAIVADEAHKAKDPNSKQTRALWAVSRDARFRYAATGTPIANNPGELWSIMNFVAPKDFPRKSKFVDRYCVVNWNNFGGMEIVGVKPETAQEFHNIVDSRMIRRLKEVVLPHLPPKRYQTRYVNMGTKQTKAYNQMADHMLADLDGDMIAAVNPLTQMTRLSQFATAYAEVNPDGDVVLTDPSNKCDALMEILEEAEGQRVVVFAESRQLIEIASRRIDKTKITYGLLTGAVDIHKRQQDMETFQAGGLQVMLVTLGAGGEGVTLTAAGIAVFLQRSWSMVKNKQAEDRVHRPGSEVHDSIEIIDVVSQGTIEEYRAQKLDEKEDRFQEVVRDDLRTMLAYRGE